MSRNSKDGSYYRTKKLESIAKKYLFLSNQVTFLKLCTGSSENNERRRLFVRTVDQTLESIDVFHKKFIIKEFFTVPSEAHTWWIQVYSRSTYYRYRDESIKLFLDIFYEKYKASYGFDFYNLNLS